MKPRSGSASRASTKALPGKPIGTGTKLHNVRPERADEAEIKASVSSLATDDTIHISFYGYYGHYLIEAVVGEVVSDAWGVNASISSGRMVFAGTNY